VETRYVRWSSNDPADRFSVENPANGETIAVIQGAGAKEVDAAVTAADVAFRTDWRNRLPAERGVLMMEISRQIRDNLEEIATLESKENGKPLPQARADVEACIATFAYFGGVIGKIPGDFYDNGLLLGATVREPYGVVGAIIPFNWPPIHTAGKIAPAIAMGNTVVVKPPEQTPLCILRIIEIIQDVLPPDVVHVVPGYGPAAGSALASHKLVRKLSFTGSTSTGAAVVIASAPNTTPTLLELGGKNAMMVFEDADLDMAARWLVEAGYYNQGEACTAGSRILVHRSLHDALVARMAPGIEKLKVGDGMEEGVHVGGLVTRAHQQKVLDYIRIGLEEGATVAAQAKLPPGPAGERGFFVAPTLLTNVHRHMRIAREEIFGPVICVIPFDSEEEAISIANDTDYGLTCSIFTENHPRAMRVARGIDVGMCYVNHYLRRSLGMPFGGAKGSGYGREHTLETLKEYSRVKLITMPSGRGDIPHWAAIADVGL